MSESEKILVARLRNKDRSAFAEVFHQYFKILRIYAQRFLDDREEAEEVVQDVFVKFWEKCAALAPDSSVKSYLYRSVHNSCLNQLKHQKVRDSYQQYMLKQLEEGAEDGHLLGNPEETVQRILHEIDQLPPRCSEIFKLSRIEGLKYQEIAEHLEISVKTVEVQMGKALRVLRDKLKDLRGG